MIVLISLIAVLVISLLIVIKAADLFVDNLVEVGEVVGISQIILGVTASAIGTSLPEFGSAMIATLSGSPDIGVGVVIGSNIWNIAGILGISATFAGVIKTSPKGLSRDGAVTLATALILIFFMFFGDIGKIAAIVFIAVYAIYLRSLIKAQKEETAENNEKQIENESEIKEGSVLSKLKTISPKTIIWIVVGLAGLIVGCRLLVYSGVEIGKILGIPEMIMGLFTLAIGTSIPELVVTFSSAMKGLHDLSIGTVLGSNTFNIMIGIGVPALILNVPVEPLSLTFDAPAMIFVTILVLLMIKRGMKLTRVDGIILMAVYITYAVVRIGFLG
ncbi:MAG: calcium/sodium antiporter [Methanobacterium sp.]|uniref:calcium/sodium antiporter n=1 Tax=Methanobacterium sp. TaxID=2164 RepID=UPI003D64DF7A|nr:calcium/sodium antiporter [Methanobacterium sp.]